MHECMVRLCILLNSLLYICKSELRKSQSGIKVFFFATGARLLAGCAAAGCCSGVHGTIAARLTARSPGLATRERNG